MKRYLGISLACFCSLLLVSSLAFAKPVGEVHELAVPDVDVDVIGYVDGTVPQPQKVLADTIWIADWTFDDGAPCNETGWVKFDNRIMNDGNVYWDINANLGPLGGLSGNAAVCGNHDLCWELPDGYCNDWLQALRIEYGGAGFLSFDYVVDSEAGYDFIQVSTDSACASFSLVDYDVDPVGTALSFRDVLFTDSGSNFAGRVDSLAIGDYGTADTHCAYIEFFADGGWAPCDGLVPTTIGVAIAVDNVLMEGFTSGAGLEDFTSGVLPANMAFQNNQDSTPFGQWARTFLHITDNDVCTENVTCAWLWTDDTTPSTANDPSMAFGPGTFVLKAYLDDIILSPWVSLATTPDAVGTLISFRRFPGANFGQNKQVGQWSVRAKTRVANTDTPATGDSLDCVTPWGHGSSWNSLSFFGWTRRTWDMSADFDPTAREIQIRHRASDWMWIVGSSLPVPYVPAPGPFVDRTWIGRLALTGPVIDEGIDARSQAQDAFATDPAPFAPEANGAYVPSTDRFGTAAFSMGTELTTNNQGPNLVTGDSIWVEVKDVRGVGGITAVDVYGCIVSGPHAGKAPPPYTVGGSGFFVVPADSMRNSQGTVLDNFWTVSLDDDYFRGGDQLNYFWLATDAQGDVGSDPVGLTSVPLSLAEAQLATGGLFEVSYLPTINWDPAYLARIAADPNGKLEPTVGELANSSQKNCILYYGTTNSRRRSGPENRTSFMYTLDVLGYAGQYDVYDHQGFGNTNNHLGGRASIPQMTGYALLVMDAGTRGASGLILPDGTELDGGKIDMGTWFTEYLLQAGISEIGIHTLWILGANATEDRPTNGLYTGMMGLVFVSGNQGLNNNPDVLGQAAMTFSNGNNANFAGDLFSLNGGCPTIRDYDALGASGTAVETHDYRDPNSLALGDAALVMNANAAESWNTIMQSHAWFDIRDPAGGPSSPEPEDVLLQKILDAVVPLGCLTVNDPNTGTDPDPDEVAVPRTTRLHQNVPNPFNPVTEIRFDLARDGHVSLKIYDVAGRLVRTLVNEKLTAGAGRSAVWNGLDDAGRRVSSGVYFYRLETVDSTATKKMVVMK